MLRSELAPSKRRIRLAIRAGSACAVSLGICISVQTPWAALGAAYPLFLLSPMATCTWRNMVLRLVAIVVACAASVPLIGVLVDIPWAMVPVGILVVAAITYFAPIGRDLMVWKACMTGIATVMVEGTFHSDAIGTAAMGSVAALSIAVVVSTVFANLLWPESPVQVLADQLADSFRAGRQRLGTALSEFAASSEEAGPPATPIVLGLGDNIRALIHAGHEPISAREEARRNALVTQSQRMLFAILSVEELGTLRLRPALREAVGPQLAALDAALGQSIETYAESSRLAFAGLASTKSNASKTSSRPSTNDAWPDFPEILDALQDAWAAAHVKNKPVSDRDLQQRQNFAALLTTLTELTTQFRYPPERYLREAVSQFASADVKLPPSAPGIDRSALGLALKGGVAMMLAYVIVTASGHASFLAATWLAVMVVQPRYGGTLRRSVQALAGASVGGVLAVLTVIVVIPNVTGPFFYLLATFAVATFASYGGHSSERLSFGFFQLGMAYLICIAMLAPTPDVVMPLARVVGILIGVGSTYVVFRFVSRDYAGNHALRLLSKLLLPLPRLIPHRGQPLATLSQIAGVERDRVIHVQSALQVLEEVRFEGASSGIDIDAALEVCDIGRRVAVQAGAVALARTEFVFRAASDDVGTALREAQGGVREWLSAICNILEVTENLGQPNTRRRRRGRRIIEQATQRPLPPIRRLIDRLQHEYDSTYFRRTNWTQIQCEELASELVHLRRLGVLLPRLRRAVTKMCLPKAA